MSVFSRIKVIFSAILIALSIQGSAAQEATFKPEDNKTLSSCLLEVQQVASRSQMQRSDCIGVAFQVCTQEADGGTTLGTTFCYLREKSWWDAQLNTDYNALKNSLGPDLFESLRQAQITWIAYRDAKCDFVYKIFEDGSIRHILFSNCVMRTTANRSIELKQILNDWMG